MAYVRKTVDEFDIMVDYGTGFEVVTCESTLREARQQVRTYIKEEGQIIKRIKIAHHLVKKKV